MKDSKISEDLIKEYVLEGGKLWSIKIITIVIDGGTIAVMRTSPSSVYLPSLYIDRNKWTCHISYPLTNDNIITDKPTLAYMDDRLAKYKRDCEHNLAQANRVIDNLNKEDD